jgi:hypothetical protein
MRYMKTILQTKSMKLHLIDFKMYTLSNKKKADIYFSTHNGISLLVVALYRLPEESLLFFETMVAVSSTVSVSLLLTCVSIKYHLNILHTSHDSNPTSYTSCCLCMLLFFYFEIHWCGLVNPFL